MKNCSIPGCNNIYHCKGYCKKHYRKYLKFGDPLFGIFQQHKRGEGGLSSHGYYRFSNNNKRIYQHHFIIIKTLGYLPSGSVCHHIDGNKNNNVNSNLILCDSQAYHVLLHARKRAYEETGHSSWKRCSLCKKYDDPNNMLKYSHYMRHRKLKGKCIMNMPVIKNDCPVEGPCPTRPGE